MSLPARPVMLDPTVPRCSPRLPIIPSTFNYAKPVPEIAEPSLIFDYHNLKNSEPLISDHLKSNHQTFVPAGSETIDTASAVKLTEIVLNLQKSMSLLQSQVDAITATQEAQDTKLDEILMLLRSNLLNARSDQTQTAAQSEKPEETETAVSRTSATEHIASNADSEPVPEEPKSRHNSGSSAKSSSSSGTTNTTSTRSNTTVDSKNSEAPNRVTATKVTKQSRPAAVNDDSKESVSVAIGNLRLPTVQESLFSENSMHTIDLEEFDNSMDDSFEEGDASPDPCFDNPVKPTNTFYRKVIGNVRNNLLEQTSNEPSPAGHGSETTIYGMSSNNLSFATRQYLHKYGLTQAQGTRNSPNAVHNTTGKPPERLTLTRQDRLLDLNALRNHPKFL